MLHFGGNGHAAVRLEAVRAALASRPGSPELVDVPYPGFEGRPRAPTLEAFLDNLEATCRAQPRAPAAAVASGIGALVALCLRARGGLDVPLIFQGPVLWGLERRTFPAIMRLPMAQNLLSYAFTRPWFQDRFVRAQFLEPLDDWVRARFFEGYAQCSAFGDLFRWFTPAALLRLKQEFAERPGALDGVTVWIGGRDHVVDRSEVQATERALAVRWPAVEFPTWGHYPMIDVPGEWADALRDALAAP